MVRGTLSLAMRATLERFLSIRDLQVRQMTERLTQLRTESPEFFSSATPSRWVFWSVLVNTHGLRQSALRSLVARGLLKQRSTDGFGPELAAADDYEAV